MRPHRREPTRLPSLGFSRQEHWSGLPFPSPMHESEKWKWSRSVVSDSSQPHGLQPTRLLHPWDFPGKSTGVGLPVPSRRPAVFNGMESKKTGFPVHHQLLELAQTHIHQFSNAIQSPYPLCPLLLLPSVFPSIRVFSNESVLHIRWLEYWSFSFSIIPSNEQSGLTSFRIDWFDLAV